MAKKIKKTEEIENQETVNPIVEEVLEQIEEKIQESQPSIEIKTEEIKLDKEIQEISEDFKDTSKRLESIVANSDASNIQEALQAELERVVKAEEVVKEAIAKTEKEVTKEKTSNSFSHIRDFGSWWNGSNSGL
jgi:glutamine synthetase type III